MSTLNDEVTTLRNTVDRKLNPPFRPPSCDMTAEDKKPMLKECPFCADKGVTNEYDVASCPACAALGPDTDPHGTKWNSIPRKSELKELLRLVQEFREFHELESIGKSASFQKMVIHANKLRKEWKL